MEKMESENGFFNLEISVNGGWKSVKAGSGESLLDVLRRMGYKGAKKGCDSGDCGSCAVIVDSKAVLSCLIPAVSAHGLKIETIEGLGSVDNLHPIQRAYVKTGAVQCGYCVPGMIMSTKALLDENPVPDDEEIRKALDGNLCRCTGYVKQIEAVKLATAEMKKGKRDKNDRK